jgi:hypothetical protein
MSGKDVRKVATRDEQLKLWVEGESVHLALKDVPDDPDAYCCCPDFSCCQPQLRADLAVRQAFRQGDENQRGKLLMVFLGAACQAVAPEKNINFLGAEPSTSN